ncbi:MAG: hypothetical protein M4D80_05730 [Myxococcota bacterium]|nr:hypothetical protein [Myxococcota bacterium]
MARYWVLAIIVAAAACSKKKTSNEASGSATGSGSAVAGSGSGAGSNVKYAAEWNVSAVAGVCSATEHGNCPPDKECEAPAARAIECPAGLVDGNAKVGQLEDNSCVTIPGNAKTACPLPKGEALPTLTWAVTAAPDGTCVASWTSPATGTKSLTIKCPLSDVTSMTIKRAKADAPCSVEHAGKATAVPCPAEPKDFTVASLREAIAKDAKPFAEERVRVKGFYVKSMVAQQASGKATTYILGAADAKGDMKNAIKCTSTAALGEAADGEEVIVEGLAKKGTNNELSLVECQATKP